MMEHSTFIVTAALDDESSRRLNALRKQYFPPHRNLIDAHVTLFHKLSARGLIDLEAELAEAAPTTFEVALSEPYTLGHGVAIRVTSSQLVNLRNRLASRLHAELSAQDRQPYTPHVTVQNKVTAEEAKQTLLEIRRDWLPTSALVEGLDVWEYLGGPWRHHARLAFPT